MKNELELNTETIHFLNSYCFNVLENILLELLNLYPEIIVYNKKINDSDKANRFFREKLFINLLNYKGKIIHNYEFKKENIIFNDLDKLYNGLERVIEFIMKNSEYENKFENHILPFLINNGYFFFKSGKKYPNYSFEIKLFLDLLSNNYNILSDKNYFHKIKEFISSNSNSNYLLYYLSFILRIGITEFIIFKNNNMLENFLFNDFDFSRLKKLTNSLKKNSIEYMQLLDNMKIFLDYLINSNNDLITREKIIVLLDIGSSLSLLLIALYFNNNYLYKINLNSESLLELFQNLYKLSNIISSSEYLEKMTYNKKLILFSLYAIFNISPIPCNNNVLNIKIFKIYDYINGCLLNCNSILKSNDFFSSKNTFNSKYFDIFSPSNNDLYKENYVNMFNVEGNNIIINYTIATTLFKLILSSIINITTNKFFNELEQSILYPSDNRNINNPINSPILFFYHTLNFYFKLKKGKNKDRIKSTEEFWRIINWNFFKSSFNFPFAKDDNNYFYFFFNDYLKDLMFYDKVNFEVLYSFLMNYNMKKNDYNIYLLIFLLKEKWNIDFKYINNYIFKNESSYYYGKLKICLNHIKNGKTNIFISLLLLRRIFPKIILLIEYYLKNYSKIGQFR